MKKTKVKVTKKISGKDLKLLQELYQDTYDAWLDFCGMTEDELFEYRVVDNFKVEKEEVNGRIVVGMTYVDDKKNKQTIGEPFIISDEETMMDVIFLLLFIAKKLDSENETAPINKSHSNSYFMDRVRKFAKSDGLK